MMRNLHGRTGSRERHGGERPPLKPPVECGESSPGRNARVWEKRKSRTNRPRLPIFPARFHMRRRMFDEPAGLHGDKKAKRKG